eukprot:jgi/Chlat1/2556/Chrsp175S02408
MPSMAAVAAAAGLAGTALSSELSLKCLTSACALCRPRRGPCSSGFDLRHAAACCSPSPGEGHRPGSSPSPGPGAGPRRRRKNHAELEAARVVVEGKCDLRALRMAGHADLNDGSKIFRFVKKDEPAATHSAKHEPEGDGSHSLELQSGFAGVSLPEKSETGGEDAWFISDSGRAAGVADGVGGWSAQGIDAGVYARELMSNAEKLAMETDADAQALLERAHSATQAAGSATVAIMTLHADRKARVACVGDCGFMHIRDGQLLLRSEPQLRAFNSPRQVGSNEGSDHPHTAQRYEQHVQEGDVLVLASDGIFDNLFDNEILQVISTTHKKNLPPVLIAKQLVNMAQTRSYDRECTSPFSMAAQQANIEPPWPGGKPDDITVIVSLVSAAL